MRLCFCSCENYRRKMATAQAQRRKQTGKNPLPKQQFISYTPASAGLFAWRMLFGPCWTTSRLAPSQHLNKGDPDVDYY